MPLDIAKLNNVRVHVGKTIARCPACAEQNKDAAGEHLIINADGSFGCVLNQGASGKAHRARIFELAGKCSPATSPQSNRSAKRPFLTLDVASSKMTTRLRMPETRRDIYVGPDNRERFAVLRFDSMGRKEYRPFYLSGRGWSVGDPLGPLPLFNLPALLRSQSELVFVTEGEKAACKLSTIAVLATTSAHGAKSASKTDWSPLAGRRVVILPDNDVEGKGYADAVFQILRNLNPPSQVKIVLLPDLPVHGDAVEWLGARDAQMPEDLRAELNRLIETHSHDLPERNNGDGVTEPQTFTVHVLPDEDSRALRAKLFSLERQKLVVLDKRKMMAQSLIQTLHSRGRFFFHSQLRDHKTALFFDSNRKLLLRLSDPSFLSWLALFTGVNRSENDFRFLQTAVEDEALQGNTAGIIPETFWAAKPSAIYLSNGDGSMARIRAGGIDLVDNGTDNILFEQGATLLPWRIVPEADPFELRLFRDGNFDAAHGLNIVRLWTISLPANHECKPPLVITGEIRSGKTLLVRGLFQLLGIPGRIRQPVETEEGKRDFWISINAGGLICLDNADTNIRWLADAIATASTAGGIERKKNYEDTARVNLQARAWITITSANPAFGNDSGLADRLLVVRMKTREHTISESELLSEIKQGRDAGLSFIASHLAGALRATTSVPRDLNKRHPDFAAFAVRIGDSLGCRTEAIRALSAAEDDKPRFCLENDPLGSSLMIAIEQEPFEGSAADLLDKLLHLGLLPESRWTPRGVGKKLSRFWPHISTLYRTEVIERQGTKQYRIAIR